MDELLPDRVVQTIGGRAAVTRLASLRASDFATLMLAVARQRAARETPASLLRRYRADRFAQPAGTGWQLIRTAEDTMTGHLSPGTELRLLPPLVPLGCHSLLGPMSQDKVVTTMRAVEVAADPTNALALEAAVRRRAGQFRAVVRLGLQVLAPGPQVAGEVAGYGPPAVLGRRQQPAGEVHRDASAAEERERHERDPDDDDVDAAVVGQTGCHPREHPVPARASECRVPGPAARRGACGGLVGC